MHIGVAMTSMTAPSYATLMAVEAPGLEELRCMPRQLWFWPMVLQFYHWLSGDFFNKTNGFPRFSMLQSSGDQWCNSWWWITLMFTCLNSRCICICQISQLVQTGDTWRIAWHDVVWGNFSEGPLMECRPHTEMQSNPVAMNVASEPQR